MQMQAQMQQMQQVLIYPYWNVNLVKRVRSAAGTQVLIYPYWNVNVRQNKLDDDCFYVLIYPHWNVNDGIANGLTTCVSF